MSILFTAIQFLAVLVIWYACYLWLYDKITMDIKLKVSTLGNIFLVVFTPILAFITIVFLIMARFLKFLDKE